MTSVTKPFGISCSENHCTSRTRVHVLYNGWTQPLGDEPSVRVLEAVEGGATFEEDGWSWRDGREGLQALCPKYGKGPIRATIDTPDKGEKA